MAKSDPAHEETERILKRMELRIKGEYRQAEYELTDKLADYFRRYEAKDRTWKRWVSEGKKTEQQYRDWKVGQLAMGRRWEEMQSTIAEDIRHTREIAMSVANGYRAEVYALNHDYSTFIAETTTGIDTSYTLYRREAAERIFRNNPDMLPEPRGKTAQAIREGKIARWDKTKLQSVMLQQIYQGEPIYTMARRLATTVGDSDKKAAIRNARTMATSAQNAGRLDAMKRCRDKGLIGQKQWIATLDSRTRHAHRDLDGQVVDIDSPFKSEFGDIRFPGDREAEPQNVWNCRCTLTEVFNKEEAIREAEDMGLRYDRNLEGMTYKQWKEQKKSTSNPLDLPERKANARRMEYVEEYRTL